MTEDRIPARIVEIDDTQALEFRGFHVGKDGEMPWAKWAKR
jgi:hypothetical protein